MTKKVTNKTTKSNVANSATTEVKKSTTPKPTIKSLQQEVANQKEISSRLNDLVNSLEEDKKALFNKISELNFLSATKISQLTSKINDLENRSLWAEFWFRISKSFR